VLSRNQIIENFTTVVAEKQTQGKGQMGATWISEEGKNLIMSKGAASASSAKVEFRGAI
jgi:biotin-(acetyl-CoA carboxylase) ligase